MDIYNSTVNLSPLWASEVIFNSTTLATTAEQGYSRNDTDGDEAAVSLAANFYMKMVYLLVGVLGMISNILVIVTIICFRELRRRMPNMFILNQSLLDCTAGFFLVATTLFNDISVIESAIGREMFCRLWLTTLPTWGIFLSSTYNLVAVTFERYMAIVYPLSHSRRFTRRRAYVVMVCVWCVGPIYNAAYMVPSSAIVHGRCSVFTVWPNEATQSAVGIITVVVQYFIPLVFISFCYGRIASVLSREDDIAAGATVRSERAAKARRNIIKILAMVSVCFVACWSANQIYFAMYNLGFPVDFNGYFYHFTVISVFVNCCVNPFVYALKYDQFQTALQKLFCRKRKHNGDFLSGAPHTDVTIEDACPAAPLSDETCGQASNIGDVVLSISTIATSCGGETTASVQLAEAVTKAEVVGSLDSTPL